MTFTGGSPAVCAAVLDAAANWDGEVPGRDRVRIIVAGAPPPTSTIERIETDLGWEFIQLYGLTETAPMVTVSRRRAEWDDLTPTERAQKLGRAGAPAIGVAVRVSADGEIIARANHILTSYWRNPEATAEAIRDGWFHTGDGGVDRRRGLLLDHRPQEGRDHLRRRERQLDRGRRHAVLPSCGQGGGGDRCAPREVGRDGEGAGRARRTARRSPNAT